MTSTCMREDGKEENSVMKVHITASLYKFRVKSTGINKDRQQVPLYKNEAEINHVQALPTYIVNHISLCF